MDLEAERALQGVDLEELVAVVVIQVCSLHVVVFSISYYYVATANIMKYITIIFDQSNVAADKNTSLTKGVADKIRGLGTRSVLLKQNINVNKFAYNSSYDQSQVDSNKKFCYVRRGVVVKQGEKPIGFFIT